MMIIFYTQQISYIVDIYFFVHGFFPYIYAVLFKNYIPTYSYANNYTQRRSEVRGLAFIAARHRVNFEQIHHIASLICVHVAIALHAA